MAKPENSLLAALSCETNFSVGCYCEDETRCHRSVLRPLLLDRGAEVLSEASQNAAHIKDLAEQLQNTVAALEHAASIAQANLRSGFLFCLVATALSAVALGVVLLVIFLR